MRECNAEVKANTKNFNRDMIRGNKRDVSDYKEENVNKDVNDDERGDNNKRDKDNILNDEKDNILNDEKEDKYRKLYE